MRNHPPAQLLLSFFLLAPLGATPAPSSAELPDAATRRTWIEEFKASPKGPFENIRWFCKDGTVLPPKPYACADHGGGIQHGQWNQRALELRAGGYAIANVLAQLDATEFTGENADLDTLKQLLVERFLIGWEDGWIFRGARSYRGALQVEDEEAGARRVVLAMLADPTWREPARFFPLRETVRLLPLQADEASAADVRQQALILGEKDPPFTPLRAKIHNVPDAGDAERVREYAKVQGKAALADEYERLAQAIDDLYAGGGAAAALLELAPRVENPALSEVLRAGGAALETERDLGKRLAATSRLLAQLRDSFDEIDDPETALAALQASLALENEAFIIGNTFLVRLDGVSRRDRLQLLERTAEALYGAGFLSRRHVTGIEASVARIAEVGSPPVNAYREELRYLARAPEWSGRWLEFHFGPTVAHLAPLEPEVHLYPQDRLRGSPLLFYGALIDGLVLDANRAAGIEHDLFSEPIGAGLRALNPGLARGVLRSAEAGEHEVDFQRDGIYILPETTSELPRVEGILTRGEGSSLSHVQLLARNLGIPNVVVAEELLPKVRARLGSRAVLAVSPNGVVQLVGDGPRWDPVFGEEKAGGEVVIRPDLEKLDVSSVELIPLSQLRAADSGRTSGPKGANLGELKHYFGDAVPNGFVIPFGVFREVLDEPLEPGGPSVFEWMKQQYRAIARAEADPEQQQRMVSAFLTRLREWILTADLSPEFRLRLHSMLQENFGENDTYGVFVRSDTNVEDLPGFTGAGLNLTLFNVVGYENILQAIREVWASPFTERAYGWRQAHMEDPEYVFPAVVVQHAFPSEKSGVMVTADVDSGERGWASVAVNEGVGGAVEGQASESLRIPLQGGTVRFLAQATAPRRAALSPTGGILQVPASGTAAVLDRDELIKLVSLARDVERFPSLRDESGEIMAADIEFAFRDGQLALLQIRPFVESRGAQSSVYLSQLDAGFRQRGHTPVALDGIPGRAPPSPALEAAEAAKPEESP